MHVSLYQIFQETHCLTWFDPLLYCVEHSFIYYTKHWPRARLHMTETKSRVNQTDPASILSKYIAHTWRQLQEQLGNHKINEKWHVEQNFRNVEVLWMKIREKGILSERSILELKRGGSKRLWGHGSKWQARDSTKTCWDENEEEQCD